MLSALLAQASDGGTGATEMFTNIFWLTVGFIFLTAIIGAVVARRRRDRALRLLHDYRTTLALTSGSTRWGDLWVFPQGLEVRYDAPVPGGPGIVKSSYMLYETEAAQLLAICRWHGDQDQEERRERRRQVERRACPGRLRRWRRWIWNWFNTIRDAFTQALSAFVGQVGRVRLGGVLQTQQGQVEKIGQTLIQSPGFAYEPMLEKHIGQPVVLELLVPNDPQKRTVELAGYLAEYSKDYVAIFNIDHGASETIEVALEQSTEVEGAKLETQPGHIVITNMAPVPLVIDAVRGLPGKDQRPGVVLLPGCTTRLARPEGPVHVRLLRVQRLDVVSPRTQARVRHAAVGLEAPPA